jgi:F-type H+-transporting ATPase subunit b
MRPIITVLSAVLLLGAGSAANAEPGPLEGRAERPGAGVGGGLSHGDPAQALPADALNWADFAYARDAEGYEARYGVRPGPPYVASLVNLALLVALVYFLARKPVTGFLKSRSEKVREDLLQAQKLLEDANERLADYSARLERMDEEMTRLREEFIAAGVAERDRLVADAGAKAERMRRDAEVRLQQELAHVREELKVEAVEKAVARAAEVLAQQVTDDDQQRLAETFATRLEREGLPQ